MKNAPLAVAAFVAILTLFVGKSAAQLSSSNNIVTAITLTLSLYPYYIVSLHCCDSRRLARLAWRAAIEVH
jgi:uncharacterized membrane protein YiaA